MTGDTSNDREMTPQPEAARFSQGVLTCGGTGWTLGRVRGCIGVPLGVEPAAWTSTLCNRQQDSQTLGRPTQEDPPGAVAWRFHSCCDSMLGHRDEDTGQTSKLHTHGCAGSTPLGIVDLGPGGGVLCRGPWPDWPEPRSAVLYVESRQMGWRQPGEGVPCGWAPTF